jgi:pimeloyl-ACP methyl ester carboxylesterase
MGPDTLNAVLAGIVVAVLAAVLTAWLWRYARRWWRWPLRLGTALLCVLTAFAAAALEVNHELSLATTWSEIFGGATPVAAGSGTIDGGPAGVSVVPPTVAGGSQVVQFEVSGRASGIKAPIFAYLPPGYDSAQGKRTRYPVIEAFDGYPGTPNTWLRRLNVQKILDTEIGAHRMAPTVMLFPYQSLDPAKDTECVDAVGGGKWDTYLSVDVPAVVGKVLRVRTDGAGWGNIGYSAGGFCAVNLAMRHPDRYAAAASLSGYFTPLVGGPIGNPYKGSPALFNQNSPLWRAQNLPAPRVALYVACAKDDHAAYKEMVNLGTAVRPPTRLTTSTVPNGGHSKPVWEVLEPPAFDWESSWLAAPQIMPAAIELANPSPAPSDLPPSVPARAAPAATSSPRGSRSSRRT